MAERAAGLAPMPMEPGPSRVLVVEDEPKLAALLADYLRAAGHEPECVADGREVTARAVDSHNKNLRRKLEKAGAGPDRIRSIYGVGYRFER